MPATQTNALARNPNGLEMSLVATYPRLIGASLQRVWENVLDWEHLPHLHDSSFDYCALDEADEWGWRTWSNPEHTDHIELCVRESDYVARSYSGGQQVSEIWTTLTAEGEQTRILVEFFVADVPASQLERTGAALLQLYTRLWSEDESMMQARQFRLDQRRDACTEKDLGPVHEVSDALPLLFQLRRQEFRLEMSANGWTARPTICPHLLGPLGELDELPGQLSCPWHGYIFDLDSGECVEPAHARCRLPRAPVITVESGRVIARVG